MKCVTIKIEQVEGGYIATHGDGQSANTQAQTVFASADALFKWLSERTKGDANLRGTLTYLER